MKRRRRNQILGILVNDTWITEPDTIKRIFYDHFASFFNATGKEPIFHLGTPQPTSLTLSQSSGLERQFSLDEIESTLNEMDPHKAPGPDGLNVGFLKSHRHILKAEIKSLFDNFFEGKPLPKDINSSFILLIPKVRNPKEVKDFYPISLINFSLKLLTEGSDKSSKSGA